MANATIVYSREIEPISPYYHIFDVVIPEVGELCASSFENGVVEIIPPLRLDLREFVPVISGCFAPDSNFISEVIKSFDCSPVTPFIGIKFNFNGIPIMVMEGNADIDSIYKEWQAARMLNHLHLLKMRRYLSPIQQVALQIDASSTVEFKGEKEASDWYTFAIENCTDIIGYAERWVKVMQYLLKKHPTCSISDIAEKASDAADIENVTGFMIWKAVNVLSFCWKYGDELLNWYQKRFGL